MSFNCLNKEEINQILIKYRICCVTYTNVIIAFLLTEYYAKKSKFVVSKIES